MKAGAQELPGHVQGGTPAGPGAQEGGQELAAGERPRAQVGEALARPLVAWQVLQAQEQLPPWAETPDVNGPAARRPSPVTGPPRARERAPGGPTPHNGTSIGSPRSETPRPFPAFVALGVTLAGVAAMFGSGLLAPRLGLGLRGQVAFGTVLLAVPALAAFAARPSARHAALGPPSSATARRSWPPSSAPPCGSAASASWRCSPWPSPRRLRTSKRSGPSTRPSSRRALSTGPSPRRDRHPPGPLRGARGARGPPAVARRAAGPRGHRRLRGRLRRHARRPVPVPLHAGVGLVLGLLRLRTGSLWPPVLAHVTLNALTFAIAPLSTTPLSRTRRNPPWASRASRWAPRCAAPLLRRWAGERSAGPARLIALSESPAILGG